MLEFILSVELLYILLGISLFLLIYYILQLIKAHIWLNVFIKLENYKVDLDNLRKYKIKVLNNNEEKDLY